MLQQLFRRAFATSTRVLAEASTASAATPAAYPFAKGANFPTASRVADRRLLAGKGLMEHLRQTLPTPEKQKWLGTLFGKDHPERVLPGSILTVHSTHAPSCAMLGRGEEATGKRYAQRKQNNTRTW